jgi:hypothetical protein
MLRELRGDPDRYTPPHLRGGFYTPSTRTSPTSLTSPTFCKDAKFTSRVQYDEPACENCHKMESQCLDPGLCARVQLLLGPTPEFSWSPTSSPSPGGTVHSYERFTTLTSTSRLAVCDQQEANLFSAYKQRLLLRDLHQWKFSRTSTSSSSPRIFEDSIHADVDRCQLWDFVDCVNKLVNISNKVYEYSKGNHNLHYLKNLNYDLEFCLELAHKVNISIADQADALREGFYLAGNNHLERSSAEEVNRAYYKRYNEVQLLYDEVKFKIETIVADRDLAMSASSAGVEKVGSPGSFTARTAPKHYQKEVEKNQLHSLATKRTLDFDSLATQASPVVVVEKERWPVQAPLAAPPAAATALSKVVVVEASCAAASPEVRATGHALVPPAAPLAAATALLEEVVGKAGSAAAPPEARATGHAPAPPAEPPPAATALSKVVVVEAGSAAAPPKARAAGHTLAVPPTAVAALLEEVAVEAGSAAAPPKARAAGHALAPPLAAPPTAVAALLEVVVVEARSALPKALACPSSRSSPTLAPTEEVKVHTVAATCNNVQWSARLAVLPAVRGEKVEVADTDVVKLRVTFATTVTVRRHQGRAEEETVQQSAAAGTAASALDSGESALPPPQALPVEVERLTDVPDPPELARLFKNKPHHVDDKEVVPQPMANAISMVTTEFSPKAPPTSPASWSVAVQRGQALFELETTGESSHHRSLDIDAPMQMATMNGNYKFNSVGEELGGRVLYEPGNVLLSNYVQQSEILGRGRFGKVSSPEFSILDLEHANVFIENSTTKFSSSVFAQRELTTPRSVPAEDNFGVLRFPSFQSPLAPDSGCPGVPRESRPDSTDVFISRPNLELFSTSSRKPFLELSADRADQAASRTSPAKVQLPQEVPPEPPPLKLRSLLALPSNSVLFSLLNVVTLDQMQIDSSPENNMNIETSTTDPLFCEPFVAAPTTTVGVFFALQYDLDFTATVKSNSFAEFELTMLYKPCNSTDASVFSQPSGFLFSNASLLLCCLVLTVGSLVQCCFSKLVDVSLNNSWIADMCSLVRDGGEKRRNAVFSPARWVWLVVQPPRTVCFPLAQFFVKFDAISCAHPCSVQSTATDCPAPARRATTPLSRPEHVVDNSSDPELTSDCFTAGYSGFCLTALLQLWTV